MGLAPMDEFEMQEVDGGVGWLPILCSYVLLEALVNPTAHINAFKQGWNSVTYKNK